MNTINEINSIKFLVKINKLKYITLKERKIFRNIIKNYDTFEDFVLSLINQYKLNYDVIPISLNKNYEFLKKACFANPKILRDIFVSSFHDLAKVIELFTEDELIMLVKKKSARLTPSFKKSILAVKGIKLSEDEIACEKTL